jgi:Domain of unknown function (DU1801)
MAKAENKTKATAASVPKFLAGLDAARRADCEALVAMLRRATKSEPKMWGPSIVGFGDHHLKYESGREVDWFLAGFSPRKSDLTIYLVGGARADGELLGRLGKHRLGGGCLYIKRLSDVDPKVLEELARQSVKRLKEKSKEAAAR